jgi:hypothetical protein
MLDLQVFQHLLTCTTPPGHGNPAFAAFSRSSFHKAAFANAALDRGGNFMSKTTTAHNTRARAPRTRRWTCAGCEVTVRYAAGSKSTPRRPEGWTKAGGQWLCLHCQREKAVEKATIGANGDGWASRRQALLEFELRRSPEEPDGVIAKRANCSTGHVRKVREELERDGKLRKAAA